MTLAISGLLLGLLSATLSESMGHRVFGHPAAWQLKLYFRFPRLFAPFLRCYYQHGVIHHEKSFLKDTLVQFESKEHKQEVDSWIQKSFSRDFAELIWAERYNLTLVGVKGTLPFALPFLFGPLVILFTLGPIAFLASLFSAFIPVLLSKFVHPLIHTPKDLNQSSDFLRWIARSPYMRWASQNHFLHHRHPAKNFNLLPGGDYLLGHHQKPTALESAEFSRIWQRFEAAWN